MLIFFQPTYINDFSAEVVLGIPKGKLSICLGVIMPKYITFNVTQYLVELLD